MKQERNYSTESLPINENLDKFAPPYTPEKFTEEEQRFLKPFFTNIDKPVFVIKDFPEEVIAALSAQYSRSTKSLRRTFLDDYVQPLVYPESKDDWKTLTEEKQKEKQDMSVKFRNFVDYLIQTGGIQSIVDVQRAEKFFNRWLDKFGDDSIAEMGNGHVFIEGLSNIAVKEIENKRIGLSPIEKSTRFASFAEKRADGNFQYIVPGELKGTRFEEEYIETMNQLFGTYAELQTAYGEYIKQMYPQSTDETDKSFNDLRKARVFDDTRDLLPFATQTNVALNTNGRAGENLINVMLSSPLGEVRYWGKEIHNELSKVIPSFLTRVTNPRGAEVQIYRNNLNLLRKEILDTIPSNNNQKSCEKDERVVLVDFDKNAANEIIFAFLFDNQEQFSACQLRNKIEQLDTVQREKILKKILDERKFGKENPDRQEVRRNRVPRAFEHADYTFAFYGRGGDYRDLQRHRMLSQSRQLFNTKNGYELEDDVLESEFAPKFHEALIKAGKLQQELALNISPEVAQYAVPFAYLQHWVAKMSAREIYWLTELRTGQQGKRSYREIAQKIAELAMKVTPPVFQGMQIDWNDYRIARRESAKKTVK